MGTHLHMDSPMMEWKIPHTADTLDRFAVGKDGRTSHFRLFHAKVFEVGEHVLAEPTRRPGKFNRKVVVAR